jgi:hypothetical protein
MKSSKIWRFLLVLCAALAAFTMDVPVHHEGDFSIEAEANGQKRKGEKRYQRARGRRAPACVAYSRPALCKGIKAKTAIYVTPGICQMLQTKKSCFATIGYRGCRLNSSIRGAARKSSHLCGKAVDIRLGTCNVGEFHVAGSARHRHFQQGSCP